jgi:prenyltransferase beta subunit
MLRKLIAVAVLVIAANTATPSPAPAIDFICTCQVCSGGTGPGCRDRRAPGGWNSCANWWAQYGAGC